MDILITFLAMCAVITIYKNLDWIKYMWKEHVVGDFPENDRASFCFECKEPSCTDCVAIHYYKTDPDRAWRLFDDMRKRRTMKF